MNKNMTALISCFSRAYHTEHSTCCIYEDDLAGEILTADEYNAIAENMVGGIKFFNPDFSGSDRDALRYIVNNNLAPAVLGRSAFCEKLLKNAMWIGCRQYLIFASGYDTSAYKSYLNDMYILEIDRQEMLDDKMSRIAKTGLAPSNVEYAACDFSQHNWAEKILKTNYDKSEMSFCSLLGISYYLTKEQFGNMIEAISSLTCEGSEIVFDYPTASADDASRKNSLMACAAGEKMKAEYTYKEIERLMSEHGYLIYEHLNSAEIEKQYFEKYNAIHKHKLRAPRSTAFCLAVKKEHIAAAENRNIENIDKIIKI